MLSLSLKRAACCSCEGEAATFDQFGQKAVVFLQHLHSYPSSRCDWRTLVNDQGNRNTGVEHTSHTRRRSNREKPAETRVKSVSMRCASWVIDERAGSIPTILVARFSDVGPPHDENKVRTRVAMSRDFSRRTSCLAFGAYKRVSLNSVELLAKEQGPA